jgi:hypothetical protein
MGIDLPTCVAPDNNFELSVAPSLAGVMAGTL